MPSDLEPPKHVHSFVPYVTGSRFDAELGALDVVKSVWCECGTTADLPHFLTKSERDAKVLREKQEACTHPKMKALGKKDERPGQQCPDCGLMVITGAPKQLPDDPKMKIPNEKK